MMAYSGHIMTLANSIIGVGILAMPFCFQKCGIILSVLLLIISNWITRISCHYLIKSSLLTRRKSFEFLGFHAFGASGKLLAELCIIGYLFGTSITYFVVMGDLGPQIATKMFSLNIEDCPLLRIWVMIGITIFCILPLAMLKNVDSLSTVCAASIGFYICLVLKIVLESKPHILEHDWVDKVEYWRPAGVLQCLPIFSMALSCQMQLFEVFESINNQSVEKLNGIVRNATWICTFVYIAVGFFGYVAFCTQTFSGNILMNFSPSFGSDVIKIGFILSVAFSFPLVVFPCRASLYSLLYRKGHADHTGYIPETRFKVITTCLVGGALGIALIIPSVELIIGLVGSTIGVAICIMFPALCFRKIVKKDSTERALAQLIYVGGFCLMILGTVANLNAIDERTSGAHLHVAEHFDDTMLVRPAEKVTEMPINTALFQAQRVAQNVVEAREEQNGNGKPQNAVNAAVEQSNVEQLVDGGKSKQSVVEKDDSSLNVILPKAVELKNRAFEAEIKKQQQLENLAQVEVKNLQLNANSNILAPEKESIQPLLPSEQLNVKPQQQTIDKDAIQKEEEIADEELKNMQKQTKNKKDVELKETQKELKQTKELLERTVDQLKLELAKKNEETKNFVAEKLEEVAQKVEQIEKKVNQNEPEQSIVAASKDTINTLAENTAIIQKDSETMQKNQSDRDFVAEKLEEVAQKVEQIEKKVNQNEPELPILAPGKESAAAVQKSLPDAAKPKENVKKSIEKRPPLLSMLLEQSAKGVVDERIQPKVYEPLSYKTGELIEEIKKVNDAKLEQSLPQPLAILFNVSNIKTNNNSTLNTHEKPLDISQHNTILNTNAKTENATLVKLLPVPNENDKENVEAIRRDILHVSASKLNDFPPLSASINDSETESKLPKHLRQKRSNSAEYLNNSSFKVIDAKSDSNNCLPEPKIGELIANIGISNAIDMKMQNIGRELRSVNDANDIKN